MLRPTGRCWLGLVSDLQTLNFSATNYNFQWHFMPSFSSKKNSEWSKKNWTRSSDLNQKLMDKWTMTDNDDRKISNTMSFAELTQTVSLCKTPLPYIALVHTIPLFYPTPCMPSPYSIPLRACPPPILSQPVHALSLFYPSPCMSSPYSIPPRACPPPILSYPVYALPLFYPSPCMSSPYSIPARACPPPILSQPVHALPLFYPSPCMPSPYPIPARACPPPILSHPVHDLPLFYPSPCMSSPYSIPLHASHPTILSQPMHTLPCYILFPCMHALFHWPLPAHTSHPSILFYSSPCMSSWLLVTYTLKACFSFGIWVCLPPFESAHTEHIITIYLA